MLMQVENGFTLIEVLVTLVILSFVAVIFASSFANQFNNIIMIGNKGEALYALQDTLEELLANGLELEIYEEEGLSISPLQEFKISFPNDIEVTSQGRLLQVSTDYHQTHNKKGTLAFKTWIIESVEGESL